MATLEDILWVDGKNNTPGLVQSIAFASLAVIQTIPQVTTADPTAAGTFASLVTVPSDIIMKSGKKMFELYLTDETGTVMDEVQGELDGKSFKNTLEFVHPGESEEIRGFAAWAKNSNLIFVVRTKEGKRLLFGNDLSPAKLITAPGTLGKAPADRKQRTFTFKFDASYPTPTFTGKVVVNGSGSDQLTDLFAA